MLEEITLVAMIAWIVLFLVGASYITPGNGALVLQNNGFGNTALGALATEAFIQVDGGTFNAIQQGFLMKKWRGSARITGVTADQGPFALCIGNGNATAAENQEGIRENNTSGQADVTQMLQQDTAWTLYQKSMVYFKPEGGPGATSWFATWDISFGKGFPFQEGAGWNVGVLNLDSSTLSSGAVINGVYTCYGVWLRD